jgi:predicted PurR-regulated permease PerM
MPSLVVERVKTAAAIIAVALVPVLVWYLSNFVLIVMGAILVAVCLQLGAEPFQRWLRLPAGVSLAASGLLIAAIVCAAGYLFGTRVAVEFQDAFQRIGEAQKSIANALHSSEFGRLVLSHISGADLSATDLLKRFFTISISFLEAVIVSLIAGVYIATEPKLYRTGFVLLFPPPLRKSAGETVDDIAIALRLWLLGQLMQMAAIGLLSTLAAVLIGLPSAIALGLIAGVAEFVPYVGPIIAAIPAVLIAATQGLHAVLWTVVAYLLIHQVEGNLLAPLIQRHLVYMPPAVILLGLVAITSLFGASSVIFAPPLTVVCFVLVKKLHLRDNLKEPTQLPGETGPTQKPRR